MNYQEFLEYIKENLPELMNARELEKRARKLEKTRTELNENGAGLNEDRAEFNENGVGSNENGADLNENAGDWNYQKINYKAHLHRITKNNGIVLDGITLLNEGETAAPNIYLNSYFESYQMGRPLSVIMEEILFSYENAKKETVLDVANIMDFKEVKDRIVLRLVNYEKNKEQLKQCPHKKFLDLAITFRYLASKDAMGLASSLVCDKEFAAWNIELEDLYQIALFNTMREFPWQMESLIKVVTDCFGDRLPEELRETFMDDMEKLEEIDNRVNMFVLTNDAGLNGATCILYDNVIKNFAKVQESNVFILPSSVHEVMLVPEHAETEPDFLENLVFEANQSAVGLIDLLSDHIYYYDREKEKIFIYGQN